MKVMDAIKKGFEIASKNLKLVLVIIIFNLLWNIAVTPFTPEAPEGIGPGVAMTPALMLISMILILVSIFIQGGLLGTTKDLVKEGKLELGRFTGYGVKFYLRLLCLGLVIMLIVGAIAFIATFIIAAAAPTGNAGIIAITTIIGIGLFLAAAAGLVLLFLSPYILVIEDTGIVQSMRMSVDFVKRLLGKVVGLGLLLMLIGLGVGLVTGILTGILSLALSGKVLQAITGLIASAVNGYISVAIAACLVTYYLAMKGGETKEGIA